MGDMMYQPFWGWYVRSLDRSGLVSRPARLTLNLLCGLSTYMMAVFGLGVRIVSTLHCPTTQCYRLTH